MYLSDIRFSLWADFIERTFLEGEFKELIAKGVINGATSNPTIFKNAILTSPAYQEQMAALQGDAKSIYEALAIADIQKAADLLLPLYEAGDDGYVSIEVDPFFCDDAISMILEARRLYETIGRKNVMIKIPATEDGYEAMEVLIAHDIPINATLVFSKEQAIECAKAFEDGLFGASGPVDTVISVFVSRIDRALDATLEAKGIPTALTGIYNAADIYNAVEALNVPDCRTLFASTGVKSDALPPYYYVDALLAPNSVNTAPIETIHAFVKDGDKTPKLPIDEEEIRTHFEKLEAAGIDFDAIAKTQTREGIEAFQTAFTQILEALETK